MSDNLIEGGISGESILTCAARVAQTIENSEGFSEITSLVAVRCAGLGLLDVAVELSESVDDPYMREQVLADVAGACIEFEEDDFADELLAEIEDPGLHGVAMEQMAVKYAEADQFDKALDLTSEMDDSGQALSKIALIYLDKGHFDDALEIAESIEDFGLKASTLIELAVRNNRSGNNMKATEELLQEATEIAEEIEFSQERINTLLDVASLYKEMGQEDHAYEMLSQALELCDEFEGVWQTGMPKDYEKDKSLADIAARFAQLQRYDEAGQIIERIDSPYPFAAAQTEVAIEYDKIEQREKALTLLADALEIARGEEVYGEHTLMLRENLFSAIATSYARVKHTEEALQVAGLISDAGVQFGTLREIARTCARFGNHNCINQAAEMLQNAYAKAWHGIEVSDAFVEAEQAELADRTLYQVLENVETIELPYEKALVLMEIAARLALRGHEAKASELLFNSLQAIALIKGGYQKARALIVLDDRHRKIGQSINEREERVLQEIAS